MATLTPPLPTDAAARRYTLLFDGQTHVLDQGATTIGAGPKCDLRLDGPGLKPLCCVIQLGDQGPTVRRWAAGAKINGRAFTESLLDDGDLLTIGGVEIQLAAVSADLIEEAPESLDWRTTEPASDQPQHTTFTEQPEASEVAGRTEEPQSHGERQGLVETPAPASDLSLGEWTVVETDVETDTGAADEAAGGPDDVPQPKTAIGTGAIEETMPAEETLVERRIETQNASTEEPTEGPATQDPQAEAADATPPSLPPAINPVPQYLLKPWLEANEDVKPEVRVVPQPCCLDPLDEARDASQVALAWSEDASWQAPFDSEGGSKEQPVGEQSAGAPAASSRAAIPEIPDNSRAHLSTLRSRARRLLHALRDVRQRNKDLHEKAEALEAQLQIEEQAVAKVEAEHASDLGDLNALRREYAELEATAREVAEDNKLLLRQVDRLSAEQSEWQAEREVLLKDHSAAPVAADRQELMPVEGPSVGDATEENWPETPTPEPALEEPTEQARPVEETLDWGDSSWSSNPPAASAFGGLADECEPAAQAEFATDTSPANSEEVAERPASESAKQWDLPWSSDAPATQQGGDAREETATEMWEEASPADTAELPAAGSDRLWGAQQEPPESSFNAQGEQEAAGTPEPSASGLLLSTPDSIAATESPTEPDAGPQESLAATPGWLSEASPEGVVSPAEPEATPASGVVPEPQATDDSSSTPDPFEQQANQLQDAGPPAEEAAPVFEEPKSFYEQYSHMLPKDDEPFEEPTGGAIAEPIAPPTPLAEPVAEDSGEDEVVEYMAQLMERMRGGTSDGDSTPAATTQPAAPEPAQQYETAPQPEPTPEPAAEPMTSLDEIVKREAPEQGADMDSLRQLANQSARHAIGVADSKQSKEQSLANLVIANIALASGGYLVASASSVLSAQAFGGALAIGLGGAWVIRSIYHLASAIRSGTFDDPKKTDVVTKDKLPINDE